MVNTIVSYEIKEPIIKEVKIGRLDMFGNQYIQSQEIGFKWVKVKNKVSSELLDMLREEKNKGNCRNIKVRVEVK